MNTRIKSALNQIKAEDTLLKETEEYLREVLTREQNSKVIKLSKDKLFFMKKMAIAAACIIIFLSGSTGAYAYYKTPVSYLSLDINPSIELGVNAFDKVVKVEGYNDDGEKILNGIDVTGLNVEEAVKTLIEIATDNGYISDDGSTVISLTSETDDSKIATKLETDSETGANEALNENGKIAVIYKDNVPLSLNKEANTLGITAGKLNLIRKLQAMDPTATVEQYKNESVKNIMKTIKENNSNGNINNEDKGYTNNKEGIENQKEDSTLDNNKEGIENQKEGSTLDGNKEGIENQKEGSTLDGNKEGIENQKEGSTLDGNKEGIENKEDGSTLDKNKEGTEKQKDGGTIDNKEGGPNTNTNKGVVEKKNLNVDNGNASNKTITNGNDHN